MTSLDRVSIWATIVAGCVVATSASFDSTVLLRAPGASIGVVIVALGAYTLGARRAFDNVTESFNTMLEGLPKELTFHQDDEGHVHAFVTTQGGNLRTIDIPDGIGSSREATAYVMEQLMKSEE